MKPRTLTILWDERGGAQIQDGDRLSLAEIQQALEHLACIVAQDVLTRAGPDGVRDWWIRLVNTTHRYLESLLDDTYAPEGRVERYRTPPGHA
jgi:hypothetical protein